MKYIKKSNLNATEVAAIRKNSDGYIWAILDISNNRIAIGDEYLLDLRDDLISKCRSNAEDVFGVGIDLETGEIYYAPVANRMNKIYRNQKEVPQDIRSRIETMIAYYFEKFDPFRPKRKRTY